MNSPGKNGNGTSYTLSCIDTTRPSTVAREAEKLFFRIFPGCSSDFIHQHFLQAERMFNGQYAHYQAMDTVYHDLEHTMQATLCWTRIMVNRQLAGVTPLMTVEDFEIGLVGILFHDVGYLKERGDNDGTGAKFTFVHEIRSCEVVSQYLEEIGWSRRSIFAVQHLISCTGPRSVIDTIPFGSQLERIMGEAVCTADFFGQMSDPGYVRKLPVLYAEFEESDNYRGIPKSERIFKSCEQLMRGTPFFWNNIVLKKMDDACHGLYRYLAEPYPSGPNPYLLAIEDNVSRVEAMFESN